MDSRYIPKKVKIIVGLLSADTSLFVPVQKKLERFLGRADYESPVSDFTHTEYYEEEMGRALKRKFLAFKKLLDPGRAYAIKLRTNSLEEKFSSGGKRRINIDPGYLDLAKLVLFSTKDYTHRVYLNKGIYAETTLHYQDKTYNAWPWTYPDYKTKYYIEMFNLLRQQYKDEKK